jgi:prenyltransferase beta subunit
MPRNIGEWVWRSYLSRYGNGEIGGHVATTFHFVRFARLLGKLVPHAREILARTLALQKRDGSFNRMPDRSWDVHATFDACFIVRQLGWMLGWEEEYGQALEKAGLYAASCGNADGGFGHFPGRPSDMDATYFHAGTLVMADILPRRVIPRNLARVLGWGHVFPDPEARSGPAKGSGK